MRERRARREAQPALCLADRLELPPCLTRGEDVRRSRETDASLGSRRELEDLRREKGPLLAAGQAFDWSPILLTKDESTYHSPLYLDLVDDARMLLDRGDHFRRVLDGLRVRMKELGSRRVRLPDGTWYWDLKPDRKPGEVVRL